MKMARYLPVSMIALLAIGGNAPGDNTSSLDTTTDNPYAQFDPDGVPMAVTHPRSRRMTQADYEAMQAAIRQQAAQEALDRNWLLRSYEEQLRKHSTNASDKDKPTDYYFQLSTNKDLAKLAGLTYITPDAQADAATLHTGNPTSDKSQTALRTEAPSDAGALQSSAFKPLITPLSSPGVVSTQNFSSSPAMFIPPPFTGTQPQTAQTQPQTAPTPSVDPSVDVADLETPGMVAARTDPQSTDVSNTDLGLDVLPGETLQQARAREEANTQAPQLGSPMTVEKLHDEQATQLKLPVLTTTGKPALPLAKPATETQPKLIPPNPEDEPMPVSQGVQIPTTHGRIPNPLDALNR